MEKEISISAAKMITVTTYVIVSCCPVAIVLHGLGFFLLIKTRKSGMDPTQRTIILNLCLSEIGANVVLFVLGLLDFTSIKPYRIFFLILRVFMTAYYFTNFWLTFDRFLHTQFNFRYPVYWSNKHTKYSEAILWVLSIGFSCLLLIRSKTVIMILDLTFDLIIIIFPTFVYGNAILLSKKMKSVNYKRNLRKGLLLTAMIVLSYIIFIAMPHVIFSVYIFAGIKTPNLLTFILDLALVSAFWSDAFIYIFMCPSIRRSFNALFGRKKTLQEKQFCSEREAFSLN